MKGVCVVVVCAVAVWLNKGSCLPVDEPSDNTAFNQVKMRSLFPQKEFSLRNSAAFIQSMDSLLKEHSEEVHLESEEPFWGLQPDMNSTLLQTGCWFFIVCAENLNGTSNTNMTITFGMKP